MNQTTYMDITRDDGYEHLLEMIRQSFTTVASSKEPLFTTNLENLYDIFLMNLPEDAQQHYDCRACRNFVNRYGGIVAIDEFGNLRPVMWMFATDGFFHDAVEAIYKQVKSAKITGVFVTSEKQLGTPKTGVWTHMAVETPKDMILRGRLDTAYQVAAKKKEDFKMLLAAVQKYDTKTVETAVNLLRSDSMYRGEKHLGIAEWFLDLKRATSDNRRLANILWKKSATAPDGFCHISSSVFGTLMDDIDEGYDFEVIKRRYNEKMDPLKYQRPQVAPGAGNVKRAEEIVAKLGLANSLKRRFARLDEIQTIWTPHQNTPTNTSTGVFSGIKTKNNPVKHNDIQASATTMTWEKFYRTVLPMAKKIELHISNGRNSYAAMVTAEDMDAPPIIVWDKEEVRNPISWYQRAGGSTPGQWNLMENSYVEVTGIALQPNMWQTGYEYIGNGVFFLLKNCKDDFNNSAALFPELLRGELREIRSTIEAYSQDNALSGIDEASACGLCLQSSARSNWKCRLRVTTDVGVSLYNLDRWD